MSKILIVSDCGVPTGYGRIADEIGIRLYERGETVLAASYAYDGLLPPKLNGEPLPYWVAPLVGRDWQNELAKVISAVAPDVIIGIQDMPYLTTISEIPLDWSTTKLFLITPVDGVPIAPPWVLAAKRADAFFSISHFGVDAYTKAGVRNANAVIPGVSGAQFYQLPDDERLALREKAGIAEDAFVLGTMAMNQGRKAISLMIEAFFTAQAFTAEPLRYLLDMEEISPVGWNIPMLCEQNGWDYSKLIFRDKLKRLGLNELRERYALLDLHTVIAHREGYGIPLVEAMACGVPSMAMDYCSGTEICGGGKGLLIPTTGYNVPGTWGGANDFFPDKEALRNAIVHAATNRDELRRLGEKAHAWAITQTWDAAFEPVWAALKGLK